MTKENKKDHIKKLYVAGVTITAIANQLSVTRQTIYAYKNADLKNGICWDDLALASARDLTSVKMTEKEFIATLIKNYENDLNNLFDKSPEERLEIQQKYATTYYKLKAPIKTDCKSQVIEAINSTIYLISEIALATENKVVIDFLSTNADKIIERALQSTKGK